MSRVPPPPHSRRRAWRSAWAAWGLWALLSVGCAAEPKEAGDSGPPLSALEWDDTGLADATWEAAEEGDDASESTAAAQSYDGLRPVHPDIAPDADDAAYRPGEAVHVAFDLQNTGTEDYPHHPGLVLTSDHPEVEIPDASQWIDGLAAGEQVSMAWWAVLGPMVHSGDTIRFTATVTAHSCEDADAGCPVAHSASVLVVVD